MTEFESEPKKNLQCGLVMPISSIDGCDEKHWEAVQGIIREAVATITNLTFIVDLVSKADSSGVIHKNIVQNIYTSEIIICDLSGKNPNVLFELGMRLTFDKAIVIIKDDKTDYNFDTGIIDTISYPRDLNYPQIQKFKIDLAEKVKATYLKSKSDLHYSPFLKNFGEFQVQNLNTKEVPQSEFIINILRDLQKSVELLQAQSSSSLSSFPGSVVFTPIGTNPGRYERAAHVTANAGVSPSISISSPPSTSPSPSPSLSPDAT